MTITAAANANTTQVYRVYSRATPEAIWDAITRPDLAAENQQYIERVFDELCANSTAGIRYVAFKGSDGVTFVHLVSIETDSGENPLDGTVEAWGRSPSNPIGGWYGLKKGLRGRFGMYIPPLLEALGMAEVEHQAKGNRIGTCFERIQTDVGGPAAPGLAGRPGSTGRHENAPRITPSVSSALAVLGKDCTALPIGVLTLRCSGRCTSRRCSSDFPRFNTRLGVL